MKITKAKAINIFDWLTIRGGDTLVSSRFRDIIESIEPSTHRFRSIEVVRADGTPLEGQFYVFKVVGTIDSIIEEESNLKTTGKGIIDSWIYERKVGGWRCAVNSNVIAGRACWTEKHYGGVWFVSDKVVEQLKAQKLKGFNLDSYCAEIARDI